MAVKKGRKTGGRAAKSAARKGFRTWPIVVLLAAGALAAALYFVIAPTGIFKPAEPGAKVAEKKSDSSKSVSKEASKPESKPVVKVEPKPEPIKEVAKVEPPKPVEPPKAACAGQQLSLFDIQGKVGNPSWRFVDVRPADRFAAGNIPGSTNIPAGDFDAAFAREQAGLTQSAGIILYGEEYNDPAVVDVCTKMSGKPLPRIYLFREGWSRYPQNPAPK